MRNIILKVIFLIITISLLFTQKNLAQIDLSGSWIAYCVLEQPEKNSVSFNTFCKYAFSEDNTEIRVETPVLFFEKDYFKIITENDSVKVAYHIDENLYTLEFVYREITYNFKILSVFKFSGINYILKSDVGSLILLEKKESQFD